MESNVARTAQFFKKRGYNVTTPRIIRGNSGFDQSFDLAATTGKAEIVLDIASGPAPADPGIVVAFFGKIFDTKPQRAILVCIPALDHDAQNLVTMYRIETVIATDIGSALVKLSDILEPHSPPSTASQAQTEMPSPNQASLKVGQDGNTDDVVKALREARTRMARLIGDEDQ